MTSSLVPGQPQDSVEEMAPPPFDEMKDSQPPRVVQMQSDMAEKLTAAKPVSWRGRGDLPQAVWCTPPKGTILVIELWSGISGLSLALLSVGATFYAAAAETNPDARACAQASMPHIVHYPSVEALVAEDFRGLLTRRKPRAVVLGGGSPCQGNSSLNKDRKGLQDVRSQQPWHLFRLRNEFPSPPRNGWYCPHHFLGERGLYAKTSMPPIQRLAQMLPRDGGGWLLRLGTPAETVLVGEWCRAFIHRDHSSGWVDLGATNGCRRYLGASLPG